MCSPLPSFCTPFLLKKNFFLFGVSNLTQQLLYLGLIAPVDFLRCFVSETLTPGSVLYALRLHMLQLPSVNCLETTHGCLGSMGLQSETLLF